MTFDATLTFGSLITAASVLVSASALGYGWRKDRELRRREYADRIRGAAGQIAAALERWQAIARQVMSDVQPEAIEAARLVAAGDRDAARHRLRLALHAQRAHAAQRVAEERLEAAYADLYGYDPRIQRLFLGAVDRLAAVDAEAFALVRDDLDRILREAPDGAGALDLGDRLCRRCDALAAAYADAAHAVIDGFRAEVLKLVDADDERIIARQVPLADPDDVLPDPAYALPPEA